MVATLDRGQRVSGPVTMSQQRRSKGGRGEGLNEESSRRGSRPVVKRGSVMGPLFWVGPMRTALDRGGRLRAGWEPACREKEECHGTSFRVGPMRTALRHSYTHRLRQCSRLDTRCREPGLAKLRSSHFPEMGKPANRPRSEAERNAHRSRTAQDADQLSKAWDRT